MVATSSTPANRHTGGLLPVHFLSDFVTEEIHRTHHLDPFLDHLLSAKYPLVEEIYEIALAKNAAFISCRSSDDKLSIRISALRSLLSLFWLGEISHCASPL